ncbi:hypothetical protein [Streptomyces zagrosensis]|uniref:Cytidine deaminase n=1 Tax=Streptomyces zagrosensis TaxID=1042984 RepID=A0A7W9UZA5_9ACTN|nr:hypothetical protein [Streptomyces zagrosensis]MBB5936196.1 cytidine deaminase [Streptomyces zagrosensis]
MIQLPEHWPPAPEPADAKLTQLLARQDQLAADVPLVEDAASEPTATPCARCRAVITLRDRAHTVRDWPRYHKAVEALHNHRRQAHQGEEKVSDA